MKPGLLYGLATVTAAIVAVAVYVASSRTASSPSEAAAGGRLFPDLAQKVNDVASVTVAKPKESFTIRRGDKGWVVVEKGDYPAPFDRVRKLLIEMAELRTLEAKTSSPTLYASLEVEPIDAPDAKSAQVTLKNAQGGEVAALIVGKPRLGRGGAAGDGTYVRKANEAQSWLTRGRLQVDRDVVNWLDRRVTDIPRSRVREVAVVHGGGEKVVVSRANLDEKDLSLQDVPEDRKARSAFEMNLVGSGFESLDLDDVKPLAQVSFPADAPYTEAVTFDGVKLRATFAEHEGQTWARVTAEFAPPASPPTGEGADKLKSAADAEAEAKEIAGRTAGWAYRLQGYKVEQLRRKLEELLEPRQQG